MILDTLNDILFWLLLWLLIWQAYILLFNRGIPNIKTAPAIRKKIIEILRAEMAQKHTKNFTVIDLGSGTGAFSRQIARALPEAHVIGLEISKLSFWHAEILRRLTRTQNLEYKNEDFFKYDISNIDAIVFYLTIYQMETIGEKLKNETKPGTIITSNRFKLGAGWQPEKTIPVKTLYPHQKMLHVYRT